MTIYAQQLIKLHESSSTYSGELDTEIKNSLGIIAKNSKKQKAVFTVLVTLLTYKLVTPEQDIRYHQSSMKNGFSGRSVDTKEITPTLKALGYPSMAESGWLTRSLEQPYPYTTNYNGKISGKGVKEAFLNIINTIESHDDVSVEDALKYLLDEVKKFCQEDTIEITTLEHKDGLTINSIIEFLEEQFTYKYHTSGGSKLPVIALHSIYSILLNESKRYEGCVLKDLGSHTASDRTSGTSGDIEVFKDQSLFESVEVKLDKVIDETILRVAMEKIYKYSPQRYYILSNVGYDIENIEKLNQIVDEVRQLHGCQIIINGLVPTLKYYLRLVTDLNEFLSIYLDNINNDGELLGIHKEITNKLVDKNFNNSQF